jgi:hypothetical protein
MLCFQTKNPYLGGSCDGRCWYILGLFGLFNGHLVYFKVIWYIFSCFGLLHQDKSGNLLGRPSYFLLPTPKDASASTKLYFNKSMVYGPTIQ